MNATAATSRRWQIRGTRSGHPTAYCVDAFDHAGALARARALDTVVTSCALFETHAERQRARARAIRAGAGLRGK